MAKIKYIGEKPEKADNVAGTGLVWKPGQVHDVTDARAVGKLIAHADVWVLAAGETAPAIEKANPEPKAKGRDDELDEPVRVNVERMSKDALQTFATKHFRVKLDKNHKVADLRAQVKELAAKGRRRA